MVVTPKHSGAAEEPGRMDADPGDAAGDGGGDLPGSFRVAIEHTEDLPNRNGDTTVMGGDPLRLVTRTAKSAQVWATLASGLTIAETAAACQVSERSVQKLVRRLLASGLAHPHIEPSKLPSTQNSFSERVTFVIPVRDRPAEVHRLLDSIQREFHGEIIVVDDGSATVLTVDSPQVTVLRNDLSSGPAAARNRGASEARTELVAFIDSDCTLPAGWLAHWAGALVHFQDPAVSSVAPRIVAMEKEAEQSNYLYTYETVRSPLDLGSNPAAVRPLTKIAYVPAAALLARATTLQQLGGFNETMQVGEDVDFVWRQHALGSIVRYEPTLTVLHEHRTRLYEFIKRRVQYNTSAAPLDRAHPGLVPPLVLSPWSAALWAGLLSQTLIGAAAATSIATYSVTALSPKLDAVREPLPLAIRLTARGHWGTGRQLASATWRTYLPLVLICALTSKRSRRWLGFSALLHTALDYRDRRPPMPFLPFLALRLIDDAASCAGVWIGAVRARNLGPLVPKFVNWPGRKGAAGDV